MSPEEQAEYAKLVAAPNADDPNQYPYATGRTPVVTADVPGVQYLRPSHLNVDYPVDRDAFGKPTRQVAEIDFRRDDWPTEKRWRVFAVRTNERESGKQVQLWDHLDFSMHVYVTNDFTRGIDELARLYDDRAAIEPLIAELKNAFGIGKVSSSDFTANEAAFLIKLLAYNVMRRWVMKTYKPIARWRASWIRRAVVCVPARLLRTNGHWNLRLAPRPLLN